MKLTNEDVVKKNKTAGYHRHILRLAILVKNMAQNSNKDQVANTNNRRNTFFMINEKFSDLTILVFTLSVLLTQVVSSYKLLPGHIYTCAVLLNSW